MNPDFSRNNLKRKVGTRTVRKILIVCEGEKTEPNYFEKFPVDKKVIKLDVQGIGHVADSLVEKAIEFKEKAEKSDERYSEVWCVFDKDSNSADSINRAYKLAENKKIEIAFSNEAFELWYVLHFEYLNSGINRKQYITKLDKLLGHRYKKNSECMYDELKGKQKKAIQYAEKLLSKYSKFDLANNNPSTTVYNLVKRLNEFKK